MTASDPAIAAFGTSDVDAVWEFFARLPDRDRTFVKEPVTGPQAVRAWLDDERGLRSVARDGDRVVGYVAVIPGVGWSRHVGELRLVVDPADRRRGLGQRLARHALAEAVHAGLSKLVVEVVADDEPTIALFTRLGFRAEALLADHVEDPDGGRHDLVVLANRTDDDWQVLTTVGLDAPLDDT